MIKSMNIQLKDIDYLKNSLSDINPDQPDQCLIQIFSGILDTDIISQVQATIRDALPGSPIIGVTTAGEIMNGESLSDTMIINITTFEKTVVRSTLISQNDDLIQAGNDIVKALKTDNTKSLIVLGCGLKNGHTINATDMMASIQSGMPGVPVSGAQAGENGQLGVTYVFDQDTITSSGVVAASLNSEVLEIVRTYNLSWIPIGKKMTITKAEGSRVYEIDHMPPYEIYKFYLGEEVADGLPLSAADFPLIIDRDGMRQAIHATGVNKDGSFNFIHDFRVGEQMRFGYCHVGLLALGANETYELLNAHDLQAAFVYTCVSRKWVLGEDIEVELAPISEIPCSAGFYSYGEYYQIEDGSNLFLGQTMTVLGLSENTNQDKVITTNNVYNTSESRQFKTMRVLHRLIEKSTNEIERMNVELADLVLVDTLTNLGNRRRFDQKIKKMIYDSIKQNTNLGLIMFDIDNFKSYNDTYGHVAGDNCLRGIGQVVLNAIQDTEYVAARYGGEEFAILLPNIDTPILYSIAEKIRQDIEKLNIKHIGSKTSYVTASFGALEVQINKSISPNMLIKDCDTLLYEAKNLGKNQTIIKSKTY